MQAFRYELEHIKRAKQFELEEKLQDYRARLAEEQRKSLEKVTAEYQQVLSKYSSVKEQECQSFLWEAERKSKEEYLRSLKALEQKFAAEEEMALLAGTKGGDFGERERVEGAERLLGELEWEENELKRQLEGVRLEISNLRSQSSSVGGRLNDNQMRLYNLIQDKIKARSCNWREERQG